MPDQKIVWSEKPHGLRKIIVLMDLWKYAQFFITQIGREVFRFCRR